MNDATCGIPLCRDLIWFLTWPNMDWETSGNPFRYHLHINHCGTLPPHSQLHKLKKGAWRAFVKVQFQSQQPKPGPFKNDIGPIASRRWQGATHREIGRGRDIAQAVEHLPVRVWIRVDTFAYGLFSVLTSGLQLVHQRLWCVLSCLWESAYKRSLAAYQKE